MLRAKKTQVEIYVGFFIVAAVSLIGHGGTGLRDGCSALHRFTYPLFHQNIFHALANLWVLRQCLAAVPCGWHFLVFYAIAVSYPFAGDTPIVGLSGLVYAYMGYIAPRANRKIRYNILILLYISVGFVFPCMAIGTHIYCYALGLLWGYLNAPLCQDR